MSTEADTCRLYVLPKLRDGGWTDEHIQEQRTITKGRIVVVGDRKIYRKELKRPDYLLRYSPSLMIAVVEAKADFKGPGDGLQKAKEYAQMLDLKFAYSTNGKGIVEHNFLTGKERALTAFPSPSDLWARLSGHLAIPGQEAADRYLTPTRAAPGKPLRYYQENAINRAIQAILRGQTRVLLTMATGTGKTDVAFHICSKLWRTQWNIRGEPRRPRILFLADRTFLVDDPKDKTFADFGDARWKIQGKAKKGREMYFATYQAIAADPTRSGIYRDYPPDYFDLIVVDECHRGSSNDESNWRDILTYFSSAIQLGMTATPLHDDNKDTYAWFGMPVYTYSLRQGIEDGFLAPYRVHRIVPDIDATGFRPLPGEQDLHGRDIPDQEYLTPDFERLLSHKSRTEAMARSIAQYLQSTDPFAKTIVFCVDMEHAEQMRLAISNECAEWVRRDPNYVVRIVAEDGKQYLSDFRDVEKTSPTIVTTSRLLSTGVDVPTCRVVVLARVIKSMTEFKQIIGRGTRVREDCQKYFFTILDYTGCATRLFADPSFDGDPVLETVTPIGKPVVELPEKVGDPDPVPPDCVLVIPGEAQLRKFYVDGERVEMAAHVVYDLDAEGRRLRAVSYTDYVAEKVGKIYRSAEDLRSHWTRQEERDSIFQALEERGIDLGELADIAKQPDADPLDLLCHVAFNLPIKTRRERAEQLKKNKPDFFRAYSKTAREVLEAILEKYVEIGPSEFRVPDVLRVKPLPQYGTPGEIMTAFGGPEKLGQAVQELQELLYAS